MCDLRGEVGERSRDRVHPTGKVCEIWSNRMSHESLLKQADDSAESNTILLTTVTRMLRLGFYMVIERRPIELSYTR